MAPHSRTLAWKIPWTEEPGRLQSMGSLRVGHDWATSLSLSCIGEVNGKPLQCSCLENPRDGGAWWAAVYGVAPSQTWLKWLSSSSSSSWWLSGKESGCQCRRRGSNPWIRKIPWRRKWQPTPIFLSPKWFDLGTLFFTVGWNDQFSKIFHIFWKIMYIFKCSVHVH